MTTLTFFLSVLSNKTTRPPRSPVARWSPVLSNSMADIISTAIKKIHCYNEQCWITDMQKYQCYTKMPVPDSTTDK